MRIIYQDGHDNNDNNNHEDQNGCDHDNHNGNHHDDGQDMIIMMIVHGHNANMVRKYYWNPLCDNAAKDDHDDD